MTFFWLSFADPNKPKGQQFLGGTLIEVPIGGHPGVIAAVQRAWDLGINPGGEVASFELAPGGELGLPPKRVAADLRTSGAFEKLVSLEWLEANGGAERITR